MERANNANKDKLKTENIENNVHKTKAMRKIVLIYKAGQPTKQEDVHKTPATQKTFVQYNSR